MNTIVQRTKRLPVNSASVGSYLTIFIYFHKETEKTLIRQLLILNVPVNSYGHAGMVSSPNHTFSWTTFTKQGVKELPDLFFSVHLSVKRRLYDVKG